MLEQLTEDYLCKQFCAQVKIHRRTDKMVMLETPFTYPDGDGYALYLSETGTGLRVSDGGNALMRLSYENDVEKFFKGSRYTLLRQVVAEEGIDLDENSGQFWVDCATSDLARAAFRLGQALTRVHDLSFLNRTRTASSFEEDLKKVLLRLVPGEKLAIDYEVPHLENASLYLVDYRLPSKANEHLFLFGIPNKDHAQMATIKLHYFNQHNVDYNSLLVCRNQEELPRDTLARLSDVGGEMISSLSAVDDLGRKVLKLAA